jgi:putative ABC transport system substrate-binding protein
LSAKMRMPGSPDALGWAGSPGRFARSNFDQVPSIAAELAKSGVQAIVVATAAMAAIVQKQSDAIPIVVTTAGDLEGTGLIADVRRPAGNITGVQILSPELMSKRLELLKEVVSGVTQVGLLEPITPAGIITSRYLDVITGAAKALGLQIQRLPVHGPAEFESAFADMARAGSRGALVIGNPMSFFHREKVVVAAAQNRIPAVYEMREFASAGGLLSYGVDLAKLHRLAAPYIDQILKGAKPGDLPVQQPTTFELAINLKTANALGLTIPPTLLARADEVIE